MDDEEFSINEPVSKLCAKCGVRHRCRKCMRTIHICLNCGKITHECNICGILMDSMSGIYKHQMESKICKKAKNMTIVNMESYIEKFNIQKKIIKQRRKSVC